MDLAPPASAAGRSRLVSRAAQALRGRADAGSRPGSGDTRNECGAPLHVTDIELVNNANGDFSIAHAADSPHGSLPANLAPQDDADVITVDVTYQPSRAGISTGQIRVRSDDPNLREVVVDLVARSIFPCVRVTPMEVDFREVLIGSSEEFTVEVTNCGNADLEVGSVRLVEGTSPELALAGG